MKHLVVGIALGTAIGAALSCPKGKRLMSVIGCKVKEEVDRRFKEAENTIKQADFSGSDADQADPAETTVEKQAKHTPARRTAANSSL